MEGGLSQVGKGKLIGVLGVLGVVLALAVMPAWGFTETGVTREFEITAQQYSYSPNVIRVNQGDLVKITLSSLDVMHGLAIDDYPVDLKSWLSKTDTVEFVADHAGKFRMRCTVVCGPMHPFLIGELIVIPYSPLPISLALTLVVAVGTVGLVAWHGAASSNDVSRSWRLEWAGIGWVQSLVKNRWFQYALIGFNLFFFLLVLFAAFFGSPAGNANIAVIFVWIVWWAALNLFLIPIGGRLWCTICPVVIPGKWAARLSDAFKKWEGGESLPDRLWPKRFRNIWLQNISFLGVALFSAIIMTRPLATGIMLGGFLVVALLASWIYGRRIFCRYICPVSGYIGTYSMVSPVEIRVKDSEVCRTDKQKACILRCETGVDCPWTEYAGNQNCNAYHGISSECFKAVPKDNISLNIRPFGHDLFVANGRRLDEVYNVFIILTCAIIYIGVYLGPWGWLKDLANITVVPDFLRYAGVFLLANLVLLPGLFYLAVWLGKGLAEGPRPLIREAFAFFRRQSLSEPAAASNVKLTNPGLPTTPRLFADFSYALIPLGVAAWLGFTISFMLVNFFNVVRQISDPFGWGWNLFGTVQYPWTVYAPSLIPYLQVVVVLFGLAVSISIAYRIATHYTSGRFKALRSLTPILIFMVGITAIIFWLFM